MSPRLLKTLTSDEKALYDELFPMALSVKRGSYKEAYNVTMRHIIDARKESVS